MSLRTRLKHNFAAAVASFATTLLIQVCSTPLFLYAWSPHEYGEWLTVASFAAILSLGEIGLSAAASNQVVLHARSGSNDRIAPLLSGASKVAIAGNVFALVALYLWIASRPPDHMGFGFLSSSQVFILLAEWSIYWLLGFYITTLGGVARSVGSFVKASLVSSSFRLLEFIAMIALVIATRSAVTAMLGSVAVRALCVAAMRHIDGTRSGSVWETFESKLRGGSLRAAIALIPAGAANLLVQLSATLVNSVPVLFIGATLDAASVAAFVAARTLARAVTQFGSVMALATNPEFTELRHARDARAQRVLGSAIGILGVFGVIAIGFILLFGQHIFDLWTAGKLSVPRSVFGLLAAGGALNGMYVVLVGFAQADNSHVRLAQLSFGITVLGLGCLAIGDGSLERVAIALLVIDALCFAFAFWHAMVALRVTPIQFLIRIHREAATECRRLFRARKL
jgi:O-antigen/teichoic acid export membrane protein